MLDFLATQFYEKKQLRATEASTSSKASSSTSSAHKAVADEIITIDEGRGGIQENNPKNMHIIGMHVHAAAHKRDHGDEQMHGHDQNLAGHKHEVDMSSHGRHVVVAQVINALILIWHVFMSYIYILTYSRCIFSIIIRCYKYY